jgi:hypothetical protein
MNRLDGAEAFGLAYGVVEEGDHLRTLPWPIKADVPIPTHQSAHPGYMDILQRE